MEGIGLDIEEISRRRNIVCETTNGCTHTTNISLRPFSKEGDEVVALVLAMEHLREEVEVRHEGSLEDDGDVASVE